MILILQSPYLFPLSARYLSVDLPSGALNTDFKSNLYRRTFCYLLKSAYTGMQTWFYFLILVMLSSSSICLQLRQKSWLLSPSLCSWDP